MRKKVSVAMATYNGMPYIEEQIKTILINLENNDELIISDDGSTDGTIQIIKEFMKKDDRIKLFNGPKNGIKGNFENAIIHTNGEYIFLADQDDIWFKNKIETVLNKFYENKNIVVVVHDNLVIDNEKNIIFDSLFSFRKSGNGIVKNIYKNTYIGCCMAFRSEIRDKILPMPKNILMHDQWIGIIGELYGKSVFMNEKLMYYRRHGNNNSSFKHFNTLTMIKNRVIFIYNFLKYYFKRYLKENS